MGSIEGNIGEEWLLLSMPLGLRKEAQGFVGNHFAPMLSAFPESFELGVVRAPRIRPVREGSVVSFGSLVRHAPANHGRYVKASFGFGPHMPFAGKIGLVSRSLHVFGPEPAGFAFLLRFFGCRLGFPDKTTGVEHMPAGDADGATP